MLVTDHAIRRYKRRIGKKHASKKKIHRQINSDLKKDVVSKEKSRTKEDHYILTTSKYRAVCYKNRVITITNLDNQNPFIDCEEMD